MIKAFFLVFLVILYSCSNIDTSDIKLNSIRSWGYQLQDLDIERAENSGFNLIVMDYSKDGQDTNRYSYGEILSLKNHDIIPIAYISIGEAESYRFYWQEDWNTSPPDWIGKENPNWEGNYAVKYWYASWKEILYSYLDRIIEQGFLGVYLDKIDEFEYWSNPNNGEDITLSEQDAAYKMIELIKDINNYIHSKGEKLYIILQNGENIIEYDDNNLLLSIIDGWGIEDLFYDGKTPKADQEIEERQKYLSKISIFNKTILSVDYVDDDSGYYGENLNRIKDYISKARKYGYIPYAAKENRELKTLNIIPMVQPPRF